MYIMISQEWLMIAELLATFELSVPKMKINENQMHRFLRG